MLTRDARGNLVEGVMVGRDAEGFPIVVPPTPAPAVASAPARLSLAQTLHAANRGEFPVEAAAALAQAIHLAETTAKPEDRAVWRKWVPVLARGAHVAGVIGESQYRTAQAWLAKGQRADDAPARPAPVPAATPAPTIVFGPGSVVMNVPPAAVPDVVVHLDPGAVQIENVMPSKRASRLIYHRDGRLLGTEPCDRVL